MRNSMSRGSFSKYSTRHGAQSCSSSFFGNSSIEICGARESKMPTGKVEPFAPLMRQQNVIRATEILSLFGFESPLRAMQLTHEIERLIRWHCQSVNLAGIPFRNRNVRLQKMRPRQIKRQPFVGRTYRFVAPMILRGFFANLPAEDR